MRWGFPYPERYSGFARTAGKPHALYGLPMAVDETMTDVVLGVDVGTGSTRVLAVDTTGAVLAQATAEYRPESPHPGWSEQDPETWWAATRTALAEVAAQVGDRVVGLGLSGQMHGAVFLDSADRSLRPAPLWNDQRTAAACRTITSLAGEQRIREVAGNPVLTGFQAPKIVWLRENEPDVYAEVASVLLPKDFVRLRLTGERATDASDAAGTLLLDMNQRRWSQELLDALDIPAQWLPDVYEGPEQAGALRADVAAEIGLRPGIPVAAGGGDNAAAAVGLAVTAPGSASCSIGTSGVLFAPSKGFHPDPSGRIHAFCHAIPGGYHLMGVTLAAGDSLRWWGGVSGIEDFDALAQLAADVPPGARGLVFLPYLSGERTPHLDPGARGGFVGLTSRHGRGEMTRAVFEGVVLSLLDALEPMIELGVAPGELKMTGGGARSPLWRRLVADILGAPVREPGIDEGPSYGAALLGGVAAGVWADVAETSTLVPAGAVTDPDESVARTYEQLHAAYADLYPASRPAVERLSHLDV